MKKYSVKELMMIGINRFMYWCWNYQYTDKPCDYKFHGIQMRKNLPKFLVEINWTCNRDHMIQKWELADINNDANSQIIQFYKELDNTNRKRFLKYIIENYSDEVKFDFENEEE